MLYFIILPLYVLFLVTMLVLALVTQVVERWRSSTAYVMWGTVWSIPGFVIANIAVTLLGLYVITAPLWLLVSARYWSPEWFRNAMFIAGLAVLVIGPLVASALGAFAGAAAGVYRAHIKERRRANGSVLRGVSQGVVVCALVLTIGCAVSSGGREQPSTIEDVVDGQANQFMKRRCSTE